MTTGLEIAVIGMACRYPGARDVDEFWDNLCGGVESITHFSEEELARGGVPPSLLANPDYVKARGILDDPALFDAGFFNINPREAELMDPQHRYFLECAWEALENAGYASYRRGGTVGVYAGAYENTYRTHVHADPGTVESAGWLLTHLSNERDYLATRVSYKLDLRGPSLTVQTACSTSLVAVHLAAQALLGGGCDLALAGGSTVRAEQREGYLFEPEGILSPDGHCRAFDARAQGTVSSSGVGIVVLKRLDDALRDRDTVHAVIKGSAINNDGAAKVGFSAPSVGGQARAIRAAQVMAGVDPATIGYVETHGSGTALGDPIEVRALIRAFRAAGGEGDGYCAIGSVKTNIGHTHAASGAAGLIKTVLALKHGRIPPSLHYATPNPDIDFEHSPFYVNAALAEWKANGAPRRAGVSAFGTGGTNAHLVLEEAPDRTAVPSARPWQLVLLSARSDTALEAAADRLAEHVRGHPEQQIADVAYTLQVGRTALDHRLAVVCRDAADAAEALADRDPGRLLLTAVPDAEHPVAFMFSGLGDQYPHMARELYESEPVFRTELDRCAELFRPHLGVDLRDLLYPGPAQPTASTLPSSSAGGLDLRRMLARGQSQDFGAGAQGLNRTVYAQPAMFSVQWALAALWTAWGIRPQAMIGYSVGEWVAACVAGVLSLPDAVFLVARRAMLIEGLHGGAMLAVPLPEAQAAALDGRLSVAAVNGPSVTVLAGTPDAITQVHERLTADGVAVRRIQTTHAFHSHLMDPAREQLTELVRTVTLRSPQIPYISNVTGTWIADAEATDPAYWARHMCQTVRFSQGIAELWRPPGRVLLEIGPGQAYSSLALQLLPEDTDGGRTALSSLPAAHDRQPAGRFLLDSLGRLWLAGVDPDWDAVHAGQSRGRVPLPTYPFERKRYWIEDEPANGAHRPARALSRDPLRKRPDIADWFSVPVWTSTAPLAPVDAEQLRRAPGRWLLFADELGVAEQVASRLREAGHEVTTATAGDRFQRRSDGSFTLAPDRREDYDALLRQLAEGGLPQTIVHLWTVTRDEPGPPTAQRFERLQQRGFYSLLFLMQAWAARGGDEPLHLAVVSTRLRQVADGEAVSPEKATVIGPCLVAPQEHPGVTSQSIDLGLPAPGGPDAPTVSRLIAELVRRPGDPVVAHRGRSRWTPGWESVRVEEPERPDQPAVRLRERGVYLITGGLGGIGLALADRLARTVRARLVLVSRSALPDRGQWARWLAEHDEHDQTAARIRSVSALEELGAQVLVVAADVADEQQLRAALNAAAERFGPIHGVVHAAGVPGSGMMQLKQPDAAARVFAPKALGVLALDVALGDTPLDFLLLCSSTIAFSGGLGQVDYCAANAFLDAFAQYRSASTGTGTYTVSVNWDAWQEVGMAARTVGRTAEPRVIAHPLLHRRLAQTETCAIYASEFSSPRDWLVDEHRMLGHPVIPGTAYLEMVRAAVADQGHRGAVSFGDVLFLAPVVLADGRARDVHVVLEKADGGFRFSVASSTDRPHQDAGPRWTEHVTGRVAALPPDSGSGERHDPAELIRRLRLHDAGELKHSGPMAFGPRSQCLDSVWVGEGVALARLTVPEPYAGEVAALGLHPFLLDVATGFASLYLERDYLMPLRYRTIDVLGALPATVYSLLRYRGDQGETSRETLSFDVTLFDENGRELLCIEEFVMKRARALETKLVALRDNRAGEVNAYRYPQVSGASSAKNVFVEHLETGILPAEGVAAFERLLARDLSPCVVVATKELSAIMAHVGALEPSAPAPSSPDRPAQTHARPRLATPYAAPRNPIEQTLADLWRDQIGVDRVGINDNFYELGGHSLLGLKLLARLRETLQIQVTLQTLFENLTVARLAAVVSAQTPEG